MNLGMEVWGSRTRGRESERIFEQPIERKELFEASQRLARLVHENKFVNVVFPDSSARPIATGLRAYWHKEFKDEPLPGVYFINPEGFHKKARSVEDVINLMLGITEPPDPQVFNDKVSRFKEVHTKLMDHKDEPTLLVDTCVHTGTTFNVLFAALGKAGFKKVQAAAISEDPTSEVTANYYLLDHEAHLPCYPFGRESLVKKGDGVVSEPQTDPERIRRGKLLRGEISSIIDEMYKED